MRNHACLRDWFVVKTLPIWLESGYDRQHEGFHEKLNFDLSPVLDQGKRTLVQARQCYVFASLGRELNDGPAAAMSGYEFLLSFGRHPDGGWRHRLERSGAPLDDARDLYDQAFALFAAAWMFRAYRQKNAIMAADETLDYLDSERRHSAGGFTEKVITEAVEVNEPRRQNPHMHLFEALLALFESTWDDQYLERASEIFELAKAKFFVDGSLREYFTEELELAPGYVGQLVEPGHNMEWVWLLHRYASHTQDKNAVNMASELYNFVNSHGYDEKSGGLYDQIFSGGRVIKNSRRLWPQTEALKAHLARFEYTGDESALTKITLGIESLFRNHLKVSDGGWLEHVHANGQNFYSSFPASTLYHLDFAIVELDRVYNGLKVNKNESSGSNLCSP